MAKIKNIIFDLNGVLFESHKADQGQLSEIRQISAGIDLLRRLNQKKIYKLFVCSNWKEEVLVRLEREFPDIFTLFDGLVNATLAQARKPDPRMFQFLCERYGIQARESLLLDDQLQNIESAQSLGMYAIHVTNFVEVEKKLEELKLL